MREVTDALLHGPLFVMGVGQLSQQLSAVSDRAGKVKSLTMKADANWLYVTINEVECGVPLANVQGVKFKSDKATVISRPNEKNS